MKPLGLYLHIPFCRSKCLYCDFCSFPARAEELIGSYVERLCRDLEAKSAECREHVVQTVYFGGGTPTLLSARRFEKILDVLRRFYHLAPDCEISAECNPATGGKELFSAMRSLGFNRLSVGLQSAHRNELRALGRAHDFGGFLQTWEQAREAGFENLNVDVMFGIPLQTEKSFLETLEQLIPLAPEHLSAYALALEEGTPLWRRRQTLPLPGEEETAAMYLHMVDFLGANGLFQYEISNFARPGYQSRHNRKYWDMEEYLGFGVAAHSDFCGERFGNSRNLDAYLRGEEICAERSRPGAAERENEYVMLQMRLAEGLREQAFAARFGHSAKTFFAKLEPWIEKGYVRRMAEGAAFTPAGFLVSNPILSEIVEFEN